MAIIILAINIPPAFAPPTWIVLVYFESKFKLNIQMIVLIGATLATAGRYILANLTSLLRNRLSA